MCNQGEFGTHKWEKQIHTVFLDGNKISSTEKQKTFLNYSLVGSMFVL